jgi:hypothetical protein
MFNNGTRKEEQENSDVLINRLLSGLEIKRVEVGRARSLVVDDKMNIESNYDENSRSIYASDNSYLRNHRQEKCSTKKFMTFTQQNPACSAIASSRSSANAHSKAALAKHIFLLIVLLTICNRFVTNVFCDESSDSHDSNGHYTHTWVVHIPGGEAVAEEVASHHSMKLMGKVSENVKIIAVSCSFRCSHDDGHIHKMFQAHFMFDTFLEHLMRKYNLGSER